MLKKKTPFNEFVQQYNIYRGIVQNEEVMGVKKGAGIGLSSFDSSHSRFPKIQSRFDGVETGTQSMISGEPVEAISEEQMIQGMMTSRQSQNISSLVDNFHVAYPEYPTQNFEQKRNL